MPTFSPQDTQFMQRALQLAELGSGSVAPNPLVGCVIVHEGKIIGEGYHQQFGQAHAEVNAVESVEDKNLISQSTVYVTLEPCAHWGNTPPCADLLIKHKPKRVIICNTDSNPKAAGGIQKLQEAGIPVESGFLADEGRWLNRRFFTSVEKSRPYILLKWAQTADGFMARKDYSSKWISNSLARKMVHKWRGEEAAVLVGRQTARHDDPQLTIRDWPMPAKRQNQPLRIVIDRKAQLPSTLKLFTDELPTIAFGSKPASYTSETTKQIILPTENMLSEVFSELYKLKIQSVMVEGGPALLNLLLKQNLWDEARVITAPHSFEDGLAAPRPQGFLVDNQMLQDNRWETWTREKTLAPA
jgi:diaminohydroxyphosphoribosylaminopyrimidine deaminase/5-amino-6-(5-phosphoribosylamino)uracil reductase